jgi:hypothetical protein
LVSDAVRLRSSSPLPSASRQGRSAPASAFCGSANVPDVGAVHCTRRSIDWPAARQLNDTPSCGTRRGRICSAHSLGGSARRSCWSAGSWPWFASDSRGSPRTRAAPGYRNRRTLLWAASSRASPAVESQYINPSLRMLWRAASCSAKDEPDGIRFVAVGERY